MNCTHARIDERTNQKYKIAFAVTWQALLQEYPQPQLWIHTGIQQNCESILWQ